MMGRSIQKTKDNLPAGRQAATEICLKSQRQECWIYLSGFSDYLKSEVRKL